MTAASPDAKPRLRGVSHQVAFFVAIACGGILVASSRDERAFAATAVYATLLVTMFGVSATFHRFPWRPRAYRAWQRLDHAMIFAFIGGTYTPFCVLALGAPIGGRLLALAWIAAGLGMLRAVAWPRAPRSITSALYVMVGWVVVAYLPEVHAAVEPVTFGLMMLGGVCFTIGALVYLFRRPDPIPAVFGFHEVFHALTILGCGCHFIAVARIAQGSQP